VAYYIFDKYGFTTGLIAFCLYDAIVSCVKNGVSFTNMLLAVVIAVIETIITYVIYTKSTSFANFLLKVILVIVVCVVVIIAIGVIISMVAGNSVKLS
jgi:uncharacterized membrane protein YedE/YeeE